ncbi:MAG: glycosyltransferase family 9 protein [Verrucomicrobiota bacterium]|jgi:ADP-heptose:LPS heptosyltransferase
MRILVFHIGQLGDTIAALPALWAVRRHFPDAAMTLLCDQQAGRDYVPAADVLRGSGIFDHFISYPTAGGGRRGLAQTLRMCALLVNLRRRRFDTLAYLAPSIRSGVQIKRDRRFFRAAGIARLLGMNDFPSLPAKLDGQPLGATAAEADLLLARLRKDGIPVPAAGMGCMSLGLGPAEERALADWVAGLPPDGGRRWLAVGPGSKMPAKRWPVDRYERVVKALIQEFDLWPVIFGAREEARIGRQLITAWGRGYNAAGPLGLLPAAAALKRCVLFLGNDTGTMHLAAAVGTPCMAVFSAREWPGMWYPYGAGHRVFRSEIACEGCALVDCVEHGNECLQRITVKQVLAGCQDVLREKLPIS